MAFDWREYLTLARWLHEYTQPRAADDAIPPLAVSAEALLRCAVSRAYFGAFGHAYDYATAYLGFAPREGAEDHGRLRAHLKTAKRHQVAVRLQHLRDWRNECDYLSEVTSDLTAMLTAAVEAADYVFRGLPPPAAK